MKLIVSDFDGTYYTNDIDIIKNNNFINEFRQHNNIFMLSSGRSFKSLKEMTKKYNIEYDYLSCCDGSILYDNKDNIIVKYKLNNTIINKFILLKKYAKINRIQYSYDDDYYDKLTSKELIGINIVIDNINITNKFLKEFEKLKEQFIDYDFLIYDHSEITYFCIKNKGINKSSTVKHLKELLNINYDDIYVFGDNENDYQMLEKYNSYYIGVVNDKIAKVCKMGFDNVYEFEDIIKNNS